MLTERRGINRRNLMRGAVSIGGLSLVGGGLAACGGSPTADAKISANLDEIIELAKEEGKVHLIAYPDNWANYGKHFEAFTKKYGIEVEVSNPSGSSAEEIQAVKSLKGQRDQPDVLDIGYTFTDIAINDGLLEAYKPTTWDTIPDDLKHADGLWVAAYYGVIEFAVNTANVPMPRTFEDLLEPEYRGTVALAGDPREGALDIAAVMSASLSMGGAPDNIEPGIDFFAKMKEIGNLTSVPSVISGLSTQEASVSFDWNYNIPGSRAELAKAGVEIETSVPEGGAFGNYYAQPVTTEAPQGNAGRLWIEWLNSDEGAEIYAQSGAVPGRYLTLAEEGKLSPEAIAALPDAALLSDIEIGTIENGEKAAKLISEQWGVKVAG